ncbi:hypothetical protein TWF696_004631 [Orbilia brochopaga]|uniref:Uncharacterized protein n=1 Tax=Orbilia brochopaga TaxID=3140254 RepID=A0AAV9V988_9PEZI
MKTAVIALLAAPAFASFNLLSLPGGMDNLPTVPPGTTENPACIAAINATIDCDAALVTGDFSGGSKDNGTSDNGESRFKGTEAQLDGTCNDKCLNSLRKWIRGGDGCSGEAFLKYFDLLNSSYYGMDMSVSDVQQYYITSAYWSRCLTDLTPKEGQTKYCVLKNGTPGIFQSGILNVSNTDALCKENNCATQYAYLSDPVKTIYRYDEANITNSDSPDEEMPMLTLKQACPGIDTGKYPTREEDVTEAMLASGSTGSSGNNNNNNGGSGGNTNGDGDSAAAGKSNAAGRTTAQGWGIVFAAVLATAAYLV